MEILSHEINSDIISLATSTPVARLVLSYGDMKFTESHTMIAVNSSIITITKEELGLDTLDNRYFRIELYSDIGVLAETIGVYHINIENNNETPLYNAQILKQELDNLNYYDGIVSDLTAKKRFQEANDFFFNYKQFLEKKLNGNNFIRTVKGSQNIKSGCQ